MMFKVLIWLPIQSMVVVTSPMGDHAPPAFAAITIMLLNSNRSLRWCSIFCTKVTITIDVVRLSSIADKKKVIKQIIHNSFRLLVVVILWVTILKPLWVAISSTMVMAPSRKKIISAMLPKWCCSCSPTAWLSGLLRAYIVQQTTANNNALAPLFTFSGCSRAMW